MAQEQKTELNALRAFCHAMPREDGSIDAHQPYMGVISLTVFPGRETASVNIMANVITELRIVQPGVDYPVRIARFRNGSLKEFQSGKRLFTVFNTQGSDLQYSDHLGTGFSELINQKVIEGLLNKIHENGSTFYRVMFTVDINGNVHKLEYQRFEKELTENAHKVLDDINVSESQMTNSSEKDNEAEATA